MQSISAQSALRRTFAIISHPDAGKTTLTERLLHHGGAIQLAGNVKASKSARHATSDWMELEKQRGISVTSSVMQFEYNGRVINLLDTPGHADFSEDTYRTLTAVDSVLMVVDIAKGVEQRTKKLMAVCRMRDTPVMTFINKMDREGREPMDVMDEVERVLKIRCAPMTWPIGMGKSFIGLYRLYDGTIHITARAAKNFARDTADDNAAQPFKLTHPRADELPRECITRLRDEIELLQGAGNAFDRDAYLAGELTPVFFGSALQSVGAAELLDNFIDIAPSPRPRVAQLVNANSRAAKRDGITHDEVNTREITPDENKFSGFVFKIQANMDPAHHDRIAFLRATSGRFEPGMKLRHVRAGKTIAIHNARTFMADRRARAEHALAGDIIGLHNHGAIRIGDTFTEGEELKFTGIPSFAAELFRRARIEDPLRAKALQKGLMQLSEEGAAQAFSMLVGNDIILGAVGVLQFEVVAHRLQNEYGVKCGLEPVAITAARWIKVAGEAEQGGEIMREFRRKNESRLAVDHLGATAYLAPNPANLQLTIDRWPQVEFHSTREF